MREEGQAHFQKYKQSSYQLKQSSSMQCKKCKSCPKLSFLKFIIDKIGKETTRKHQKKKKKKGIEIKKSKCEIIPNVIVENSSESNFKVILNLVRKKLSECVSTAHFILRIFIWVRQLLCKGKLLWPLGFIQLQLTVSLF